MINKKSESVYFDLVRSDMLAFLPSNYSKVLEIGCCTGNFRELLNKPNEYWGCEPIEKAANIAKTKLNKVLVGFYEDVADEIPDNYFDLIIANDVIEHMTQPWSFLETIKRKMTINSSIMLSIPNVRYIHNLTELLYKKDWEYKDCGTLDVTHLRFFTQKSIVRLLNKCGFEIETINGINPSPLKIRKRHLLGYWLHKLIFGPDIEFLRFGVRARIGKL